MFVHIKWADGTSTVGPGVLAVNAIATFLGNRLGSLVVNPQTSAGVVLANLGSAAGAYAFSSVGFGWGAALFGISNPGFMAANFVFPGVGAFVGFVVGSLIGGLFGKKKPKPSANAETVLNFSNGYYELGAVTVTGGNRALVEAMAIQARDILNGLIQVVSGELDKAPVINPSSPTQQYGHTGNQIWAKFNSGAQQNFADAAAAVEWGTVQAIRQTKIAGGDMLAKRVLAYSPSTTLTALAGDLQVAADYSFYLENRALINAEILAPWNSLSTADQTFFTANQAVMTRILAKNEVAIAGADLTFYNTHKTQADRIIATLTTSEFAAGWMITLQRAAELGLDEWKPSDFYGGFRSFLDSFNLLEQGIGYEQVTLSWNAGNVGVALPATVAEGIFAGASTAAADGRSFTVTDFGSSVGYVYSIWDNAQGRWTASTHDDFLLQSGPAGYVYDDLYNGVSGGNDVYLAGSGNDTIRGRDGNDWLHGGAGDDLLEGGAGNDVLIGGPGADSLYGGDGDDYLAGGEGFDHRDNAGGFAGLFGGAGNDILVQNVSGPTEAWGDEGDDLFIMIEDGGDYDYVHGGTGNDTVSYERFTAGVTINMTSGASGEFWQALGDTIGSVENVTGSAFGDTLTGNAGANLLRGLAGNDVLNGGDGNDTLEGGAGADTLNGGNGADTLSYAKSGAGVFVSLAAGTAHGGDAEGDVWTGMEHLTGSAYDDMLAGDGGANHIRGLRGNDWILASAGLDTLDGGDGFDTVDYTDFGAAINVNLGGGSGTGHTYISIEHVVGSAFADQITGTAADEAFTGGAGNDTLNGGNGADSYFFSAGGGSDTINDNVGGNNSLIFSGVTWSDLWMGTPSGHLEIGLRGTTDQVSVTGNFQGIHAAPSNVIKELRLSDGASLDLSGITWAVGGNDSNNGLNGQTNVTDLIFGYNGNDHIYGAQVGHSEANGNIFVGGLGNDTIRASVGDDVYGFDRGDGIDTIYDTGGEDTLVIGGNTKAEDVLFEIDTISGDLFIGLRDHANPMLTASQVADRIRVVGGGYQYSTGTMNTIEYVLVGGASINVLGLGDLGWVHAPYAGPGPVPPIVFDLAGDGLDLSTVDDSDIVTRTDSGALIRMGWVGPTDGILALDRDGDGQINRLSEISFVNDLDGAKTDLEGLAAYDDNGDGVLDAQDKRFGDFRLWVDANQNGRSSAKELRTLAEAGITSINLKGTPTGLSSLNAIDSHAVATTSFTWEDGTTGTAYDVALERRFINQTGYATDGVPEQFRNAGQEDAVLGRLEEDPRLASLLERAGARNITQAEAAILIRDGLADGKMLDYETVAKQARIDFSDHDRISAKDALKWADQLAGRAKLNLADGVWDTTSARWLEQVKATAADGTSMVRSTRMPFGAAVLADDSRTDLSGSSLSVGTTAWDPVDDDGQAALTGPTPLGTDRPPAAAAIAESAVVDGWSGDADRHATPWYLLDGADALTGGHVAGFGIGLGALEAAQPRARDVASAAATPLPPGTDADQQRLVQALAAFRGASGMAAVRGQDAQPINGDTLVAPALFDRVPMVRQLAA